MKRLFVLRLFFSIWLIYLFHFAPFYGGSMRFVYLTMSLAEQGTIKTDAYRDTDIMPHKGHYYINTNPGLSFIATPAWAIVYHLVYRWLPKTSTVRHQAIHFLSAHFVSFAFTSALFGALTALIIALFIYKRTQRLWRALLGTFLYAFGSMAFFFSIRFNQNIAIVFCGFLMFVLIFEPEIISVRKRNIQLTILGFVMGLAMFIDLSILPFLIVMSVPILKRMRSVKDVGYIILCALGPIFSLMLYLYSAFGNPFLPPQAYLSGVYSIGFYGITVPTLKSLLDYLISPKAGLFLYLPYAILSIWYIIKFWNKEKFLGKEEKIIILCTFIAYLLYATSLGSFMYTCFGPRYMLPVVPFVCLLLALYVGKKESTIATFLAGLGFLINIGGAQLGVDTGNVLLHFLLYLSRGPWLPILNWIKDNIAKVSKYSPEILTPYGLFLLMFVCLLVIWMPYFLQKKK